MSILGKYLVQTCYKVSLVRNEYGDRLKTGTDMALSCRFREKTTIRRESQGEIYDADAMLWLEPNTDIVQGDIILFDGVYYQIERINKARKLGSLITEFLKCDLKIEDIGVS